MNIGDLVKITLGVPSKEDAHSSNGTIGIITELVGKYCTVRGLDGEKYAVSIRQLTRCSDI